RDAAVEGKARLPPFAQVPLVDARIEARDVTAARFDARLPATRLTMTVEAKPVADGFAGTLNAGNAEPGAIDAGRVPLTQLTSRFNWDSRGLALDDLDARLPGDARVTGRATLPAD